VSNRAAVDSEVRQQTEGCTTKGQTQPALDPRKLRTRSVGEFLQSEDSDHDLGDRPSTMVGRHRPVVRSLHGSSSVDTVP